MLRVRPRADAAERSGGDRMGPVTLVRTVRTLRGTAQQYLDRRGLERPRIPWVEYRALKAG